MAADRQTDIHTHNFRKCSHASVGLAQARPNYHLATIQEACIDASSKSAITAKGCHCSASLPSRW